MSDSPRAQVRLSTSQRLVAAVAAAALVLLMSPPTTAGPAGLGDVILSTGAYSQTIPIEVPPYHGLEPKLALTYSSGGGNGIVGVGWGLSGFSTVLWKGGKFLLDGQELYPCQVGSVSPSCTTGGTHSTRIESYLRIKFDPPTNTWMIWGKDGTKTVLSPTIVVGSVTVRWGQTSTVDTYGNTVTYTWASQDGDSYPSTVAYNGYVVNVYRETRPDILTSGDEYSLERTLYRLRSLIVQLGATPIRGYKLSYATSPLTGRSLLASVQQYGKDLTHTSGAIMGGTTLPAQTFTYQTDTVGQTFQSAPEAPPTPPNTAEPVMWANVVNAYSAGSGNSLYKAAYTFNWDTGAASARAIVSGDGYMEFTHGTYEGYKMAGLSNGDSNVDYSDIDFAIYEMGDFISIFENGVYTAGNWSVNIGDVLRVEVSGGQVKYRRNGILLYTSSRIPVYPLRVDTSINTAWTTIHNVIISGTLSYVAGWCGNDQMRTGDFNGDGRTDQLCYGALTHRTSVRLATANGFGPPTLWLTGSWLGGDFFLADFNGDGKTDIGVYEGAQLGNFDVGLSTGSSFNAPVFWGRTGQVYDEYGRAAGCNGDPLAYGVGDFNGDGYADIYCKRDASLDQNIFVGLSNGASAFSFAIWVNTGCPGPLGAADFNGDGRSDMYCINPNDSMNTFISNGGAFFFGTYTATTFCWTPHYVLADLNGDGKTDLACRGNGNVALSIGTTFVEQGAFGGWCISGPVITGDFDGDGSTEIACNGTNYTVGVRKWQGNSLSAEQTWKTSWCGAGTSTGDFDGDGKTDLFCPSYGNPVAFAGSAGVRADLATSIANGLGGTSQVTYVPSTNFVNTNNPGPSLVVSSVTIGDGRGGSSTSTYRYAGGKVYRPEHRPLGFASATMTLPCVTGESTCPSVESSFQQDLGSAGKPSAIVQRDQAGHPLTQKTYVYTTNGSTLPRTSLLTGEWTYTFDGSGASCQTYPCVYGKRTLQSYQYDAYGNTTRKDFSGDYDLTGDETIMTWSYRPNTTAYIVDRVAEQKNYGQTLAAQVKSQAFWYDGQNGTDFPPIKGSVTKSLDWLNTGSRWVMASMTYDSFGNLTSTTDPTARAVATTFDTTYQLYPTSMTNGATESKSTIWDPLCSVPTQRTDVAGQITTMQWDALCRLTTTSGPLGAFEIRSYLAFGSPSAQRVRVESPSATPEDGTGNDFALEYIDGLGRTYRAVKKGPSPTQDIAVDTTYNARGEVASRTQPYYPADTPRVTTFAYDALGRLTLTTHPDGRFATRSYGIWMAESADEHNPAHVTGTRFDASGRAIVKEQHINGQTLQTQSTYEALGRLVGMTDPAGNTWSWTYDWLGRNTVRSDPDSGTWTFEYDDAGRVTAQIDAKAQRTDFTYDAAGRLATKVNAAGTVSITRSEPRTGYVNIGQVTTVSSPGTALKTDYDALGRAVRQVRTLDATDYVAERRYDSGGRLRGITYPDGDAVGTTPAPLVYDAAGRLKAIPGIASEIRYDAAGRATNQTNLNGTVTTRTYSPDRGFLTHVTTTGATTIQDVAYTFDDAGLVTQVTSPFANEGWTYFYDGLHRLTSATNVSDAAQNQAFQYDDSTGNITNNSRIGSYTYPLPGSPRPHAPTVVGTDPMTYDNNGNLSTGRSRSIQWNADNLPTQINTSQFAYDGLGERLKKSAPGSTSLYPFGDDYEVTNGTITKYVNVEGLGVVAKRVGTDTLWLHTDRLGSIQAITNLAGADVQHRTYRPYGEKIADTSAHTESRGYIGERQDADTGLTYLHARYYDSALGVFLSPDPANVSLARSPESRYSYSLGDPINMTDSSGLEPGPVECHKHKDAKTGHEWDECTGTDTGTEVIANPQQPVGGSYPGDPVQGGPERERRRGERRRPERGERGGDKAGRVTVAVVAKKLQELYCAVTEVTGGIIVQGGVSGQGGVGSAGLAGTANVQIVVTGRGVGIAFNRGFHAGVSGFGDFAIGYPGQGDGDGIRPSPGFVIGTGGGRNAMLRVTNARHPSDTQGPFTGLNIDTPLASGSWEGGLNSNGEGIWTVGIGTPGSPGASLYNTQTSMASTPDPCSQ